MIGMTETTTVPAGTYFLGDPRHVVLAEKWLGLLEKSDCVYAFSTRGNRRFRDQDGHEYPVESRFIGITPMLFVRQSRVASMKKVGRFVTFTEPVEISGGTEVLTFGSYRIRLDENDE